MVRSLVWNMRGNRYNKYIIFLLLTTSVAFISSAFGEDEFSIDVLLKEVRNQYSDDIEYHPTSLTVNENNDFCKAGNCKYEISDGKLSQNIFDSTKRSFEGTLKVTVQQGDTKVTKLFPFNSDLSISEIRETGGKSVELLDGKISFGKDIFNPEFEYSISNGTLTLQGKNASLSLSGNTTGF